MDTLRTSRFRSACGSFCAHNPCVHIDCSEPPPSMTRLHDITETASGWIQLVKSLIDIVPIQHPMAASMITLLLDDSWLPTKECVHQVGCMVANFKHDYRKVHRERNFCIILGCLAERLSPNSNALLTEDTLQYLFKNLVRHHPNCVSHTHVSHQIHQVNNRSR